MRFLLVLLLFAGVLFAQAQVQNTIAAALTELCITAKSILSLSSILCCVGGGIPLLVGAVLFYFKKENRTLNLIGKILLGIGIVAVVLAIIGFMLYLFTPAIISSLVAGGTTVVC